MYTRSLVVMIVKLTNPLFMCYSKDVVGVTNGGEPNYRAALIIIRNKSIDA